MSKLNVSIKSDLDKVVFDKNDFVNVMVSLSAPDVEKDTKRNPISICAVIDRSGSMAGDKLDHVRQSMWKMIDHMTEDDSLSFVFFDDYADPKDFCKMTSANKEVMKQEIARIQARGSTDIGAALYAANKLFASYEGQTGSVERIMLLTDGEANMGATKMSQFESIISKTRKRVTLSTFGYGMGFNEELLTGISKQGKGNNYFIENPDGVSKVFAVELGGLLTCFAQDIKLSIKSHKGASVSNVLNDMDVTTKQDIDGELITDIEVGDIYGGETRDVVIRLDFEKRPQALPRPVTLADIVVSYRTMNDADVQEDETKVKVELVKTASEASPKRDQTIAEQVAVLEAAAVMAKAKQLADSGKWQDAQVCINTSATLLRDIGGERLSQMADSMCTFSGSLTSDYSAGDAVSKGIGNYSYSASTRGMSSVGNSSSHLSEPTKMNFVMSNLVDSFAEKEEEPVEEKPSSTGYTKVRTSK
jgi:Ca-activated chloride channel family protein